MTRVPCRRRDKGSVPRTEKFLDLTTADHKVLSEGCEARNNHRYAVVVQDLATRWIQSYPCKKQRLHKRRKRVYVSFWSRHRSQKLFIRTIHQNLEKYHGIIERLHLIDQKQTKLQNELYDE